MQYAHHSTSQLALATCLVPDGHAWLVTIRPDSAALRTATSVLNICFKNYEGGGKNINYINGFPA